ncbi:MAG TPA: hypothetical protein VK510_03165 [Solirubrobacteraceae bacterium]|nr:hypothetical protein [Solirubrobacteraceae bacterium]
MAVKRGTFNYQIAVTGMRGTGKSTYGLARARALARDHGGYLIAHDAGGFRIPSSIPGQGPVPLERSASIDELHRKLMARPDVVQVYTGPDAGPLLAYALKLRSLGPRDASQQTPIVVFLDEAVNIRQANRYRLDDELATLLADLRHQGIALVWCSQQPQQVHYSLLSMGTEIVIFRLTRKARKRLLDDCDVPESWDHVIGALPDYKYLVFPLTGTADNAGNTTAQHGQQSAQRRR